MGRPHGEAGLEVLKRETKLKQWERKWGLQEDEYEVEVGAVVWHWAIWVAVFAYSILGGHSCGS